MNPPEQRGNRLKNIIIGKFRDINDHGIFHKMSHVAVLAWVGLGADGLSSSCYGPEESIRALGSHMALAFFIALATVLTIIIICASYSQIIACFPGSEQRPADPAGTAGGHGQTHHGLHGRVARLDGGRIVVFLSALSHPAGRRQNA